jgi:putative hemolysin
MEFVILLIALAFIAFFSGIEIAFVTANKLRVELLKEKVGSARIVSGFNHNPARFISTMLIGLNIALIVFGSMMARILTPVRFAILPSDPVSLMVIETLATTVIVLLFGELIPKLLFRINADRMLIFFAYPARFFHTLLMPVAEIFHSISRRVISLAAGKEYQEGKQRFTVEDLEYLIKESAASEEKEEDEADNLNSEIFEKALYLKEIKVKNCMVHRTGIEAIEADEPVDELRRKFLDSKHSRIIVYDDTIDRVVGYAHHFDLLRAPTSIRQFVRPIEVVPASMNAQDLLVQLVKERKNIAWVVDEYGGTAGIITLEDLMEEIFGEIEDEHDVEDLTEQKLNDAEYILSGRLEVDYLNEEYNLAIPTGEYETLSGFIVSNTEDIPSQGETVEVDRFEIKIQKATDKRIEQVHLRVLGQDGI